MTTLAEHRLLAIAELTDELAALTISHDNVRPLRPVPAGEPDMVPMVALSLLIAVAERTGKPTLIEAARIVRANWGHPSMGGPR